MSTYVHTVPGLKDWVVDEVVEELALNLDGEFLVTHQGGDLILIKTETVIALAPPDARFIQSGM